MNSEDAHKCYKALSDKSRMRILNLFLNFQYLRARDIEKCFNYSQSKTVRHLRYLETECDVLDKIKGSGSQGQQTFYFMHEYEQELFRQLLGIVTDMQHDIIFMKNLDPMQPE